MPASPKLTVLVLCMIAALNVIIEAVNATFRSSFSFVELRIALKRIPMAAKRSVEHALGIS